jgi:hypothetical protein
MKLELYLALIARRHDYMRKNLAQKFLVFLFISLSTICGVEAVERDKITHASVSFAGQVTCAAIATEIIDKNTANIGCAVIVTGLGIATEAGAFGKNKFEVKDIAANTVGIGVGALIVRWKF